MRSTGHSQEAVTAELQRHAGAERVSENRDWALYARRTAEAAFGPRGSREVAGLKDREERWLELEGRLPNVLDTPFKALKPQRAPFEIGD